MLDTKLFEVEQQYKTYEPDKDDEVKVNFVKKRISSMQQARVVIDKDWNTYQTMIDAVWTPYPDERSSSTVPLASSIIELFVAEATKIKTEFNFKAETTKHGANAKALEYVRKYDRRKNNRNRVFAENEYIAAGFGTSVIYVGYESTEKIQYDSIIDEMTGEIDRKEKKIKKGGIIVDNVDIRQFYVDNQSIKGIEDASDCCFRQWISYERFMSMVKGNPLYKNIEFIRPRQFSNDWKTFITVEEAIKQGDYVELRHYRNVEKDAYVQVANNIIVREHPIPTTIDGEKALPFAVRNLGKKNYMIYGRGLCEPLLMINSELNNLRELLFDGIRRSGTSVLAIGNGLSFDGRGFSYDNEILTFDGALTPANFQQISGTPPNQAIFAYLDRLYKDISVYVGIDVQNVLGDPNLTAYQTEVQRESAQKRMNVWLQNRDYAYERFANLYKDALQTYFPQKTVDGIYPQIEVEGEELVDGEQGKRFKKKKGNSIFEVTPEILRGDIYIDVYTNVSAPTIGAVDREQKKEFLSEVGNIAQQMMMAKQAGLDVETVMPVKETLRDLAVKYGLPTQDNASEEDTKKAKADLMAKLMAMKQQVSQGGMGPGPEAGAEGGAPAGPAPAGEPVGGQPAPLPPSQGQGQTPPSM